MKIGIDARMFQEGLGIGRYIEQLLKHLEALGSPHNYIVFLRKKNFDAYQPKNPRFKKVLADYHWYSWSEQIFFPILLLRHRIDCMHFPHFNVPVLYRGKYIVTIHDLIMIKFPLSASSAATSRHPLIHRLKHIAYQYVLASATHRATHIITISECVKKDIVERIGIPFERISVIYEAANVSIACIVDTPFPPSIQKPYILYTGNAYPHKNLEGLLEAFSILARYENEHIYLAMCGQEDFFFNKIRTRIQELGLSKRVVHLGFVTETMLCQLYRNAAACIVPSFEEGFGLPALEAMAHGTPVIASNSTCFSEILGNAALYVDPYSPYGMAEGIRTFIHNSALADQLRTRGYECISRYSWRQTAEQTQKVYEENF